MAGYALCVAVAVVLVRVNIRGHRQYSEEPLLPEIQALLNAARRRTLIAVAFSLVVFETMVIAGFSLRDLVGLPILLAPSVAGSAGLLLCSATPPQSAPLPKVARREASLVPRTPWTFISRTVTLTLLLLAALQAAFLVFTGITASPDEAGGYRQIAFGTEVRASAGSPYPGWFYGIPLLVATAILLMSTAYAFWRVSSTPALPQSELVAVDAGWRTATTRILATISMAAILVQFGGASLISGTSLQNAYFPGVPSVWEILGSSFVIAGLLMLAGSIVAFTLAAIWSWTLPASARSNAQAVTLAVSASGGAL